MRPVIGLSKGEKEEVPRLKRRYIPKEFFFESFSLEDWLRREAIIERGIEELTTRRCASTVSYQSRSATGQLQCMKEEGHSGYCEAEVFPGDRVVWNGPTVSVTTSVEPVK